MTTSGQLAANRANAKKSTGPKTLSGKRRSARNARKLGLSIPVAVDSTLAVEVSSLAVQLARNSASREASELATKIAEAQVDLSRIRRARYAIFASVVEQPPAVRAKASGDGNENVRNSSICSAPDHIVTQSDRVAARSRAIHRLAVIARYERRALSRRKLAIRQLDDMLQREKGEQAQKHT